MSDRGDRPWILTLIERLNTARYKNENPVVIAELERELDEADARVGYRRGMTRVLRHKPPARRRPVERRKDALP